MGTAYLFLELFKPVEDDVDIPEASDEDSQIAFMESFIPLSRVLAPVEL